MVGPLIVIPTFNEAANVGPLIAAILGVVPDASVLVVDDDSPDGTADAVEAVAACYEPGRVQVLRRPEKAGLGTAYTDGFRWGVDRRHDPIVQMDADFQHDPASLPDLLTAVRSADMVIGSRYVPGGSLPAGWPSYRRALSWLANRYASTVLGLPFRDVTAGFRAHQRSNLERIDFGSIGADGYGFQIGLSYRAHLAGARVVEVPIRFGERAHGESKMSLRIVIEAFVLVLRSRLRARGTGTRRADLSRRTRWGARRRRGRRD